METEDGWVGLGVVGQRLANIASDFDPRTYGFRKLSDLVRGTGAFEIDQPRRPGDADPGKAAAAARPRPDRRRRRALKSPRRWCTAFGTWATSLVAFVAAPPLKRGSARPTDAFGQESPPRLGNSPRLRGCSRDRDDARAWTQLLARYRQPSTGRGLVEIAITVRAAGRALGAGLGDARPRLLAGAAAGRRRRRLPGAAVPHPARLQPRLLLPPSAGQRLGRPRRSAC